MDFPSLDVFRLGLDVFLEEALSSKHELYICQTQAIRLNKRVTGWYLMACDIQEVILDYLMALLALKSIAL